MPGTTLPIPSEPARRLMEVGAYFHARGWSVGTSSNYSVVLQRNPLRLLVTASGKDKGRLTEQDFVIVDESGRPVDANHPKSSAETMLHVVAAQQPEVGAVLHTHSVWGTILSDLYFHRGHVPIEGYEMLKGLAGITTHQVQIKLEIFPNTQDIPALAELLVERFANPDDPLRHGYLIHRHGTYTWGRDLDEARRHVEILEFLFEVLGRRLSLTTL